MGIFNDHRYMGVKEELMLFFNKKVKKTPSSHQRNSILKPLIFLYFMFFIARVFALDVSGLGMLSGGSQSICPMPLSCQPHENYLSLSDADACGCCFCHGGARGCAGGYKGRIICFDGTIADNCGCQKEIRE
jgi:hypothetical protein